MENGNTIREELKTAEQKLKEDQRQRLEQRLTKAAWKSLGLFGSRKDEHRVDSGNSEGQEQSSENQPDETGPISLDLLLEVPEGAISSEVTTNTEEISEREKKAKEVMQGLIKQNFRDAARENARLRAQESVLGLLLKKAEEESHSKVTNRTRVTDYIRDQLDDCREKRDQLAEQTPESYTLIHGLELRKHIRQVQSGEMVTTPCVAGHLKRVEKNIAKGQPTFIHGHLGSGKTELAINAARNAAIDRTAYEDAKEDLEKFCKDHPEATKQERADEFGRAFRRHQLAYKDALRRGGRKAHDDFDPLIISGSKDLTSQDLYTEKSLKLTKFNGKSVLEHKADLDAEIEKWQRQHPEEAKDPEKAKDAANKILEIYKLKNQAFGTEVENIKQAITLGVEQGRPVIIDEINTIPSAVLISLNDVLQRRPGEKCNIPGAVDPKTGETKSRSVTMQPGFAIIATGNLSSNKVSYFGTEDLNPAFLSRFDVFEHDYLPMSESDRNYDDQFDPRKNELFHVMISYLADRQGNLELPEMEESLGKIFSLCQLAHETQLVFGGKWRESNSISTASGDELEPNLEKSVLSVRNILNVLREWDKGSEKDLDKALWDGFINGITLDDDKNFVLALAKRYGFFSEQDGWKVEVKARGAGPTTLDEIHPGNFNFKRKPFEVYSMDKVVELLYGKGPEREFYPDVDLGELESEVSDEVSVEDLEEYEKKLDEIDKTIRALEILGEKCGCTVNHDNEAGE